MRTHQDCIVKTYDTNVELFDVVNFFYNHGYFLSDLSNPEKGRYKFIKRDVENNEAEVFSTAKNNGLIDHLFTSSENIDLVKELNKLFGVRNN